MVQLPQLTFICITYEKSLHEHISNSTTGTSLKVGMYYNSRDAHLGGGGAGVNLKESNRDPSFPTQKNSTYFIIRKNTCVASHGTCF